MINVKFDSQFIQNIYNGNVKAVLDELKKFPLMLEMISSPHCLLATPILVATHSGHIAIFDLLKSKGANLRRLDAMGNNLLMHAIASSNDEMILNVMACFDSTELAKALIHRNANQENVIEFTLKYFPSSVDILLGKRTKIAANDLPTGSSTKGKAAQLRSSSQLKESDDDFQELMNVLNHLTDDIVLDNNVSKFAKQLPAITEEEPELVQILNAYKIQKHAMENHKRTHEVFLPEKSKAKFRTLPVSHPILSQLRYHTILNAKIQVKIEQAVKAAEVETLKTTTGCEVANFPSTPS